MKVIIPFLIGLIVIIISLTISLVDDTGLGLLFYIGLIGIVPFIIQLIIEFIKKLIKNYQTQLIKDKKRHLSSFSRYSITDYDLAVVNKNLEILKYKLNNIAYKLSKINEYNKLLIEGIEKNKETNDIYCKNIKIVEYLNSFYDKYMALYLEAYFSHLIYYINKHKKTININFVIEFVNNILYEIIYIFIPYNQLNAKIKNVENIREMFEQWIINSDKIKVGEKINITHEMTIEEIKSVYEQSGKVIERIFSDIDNLKTQLIAYQSQQIYSSISPINDEGEYNLVKNFSGSDNSTIDVNSLTNEYDRFISEYEVTEGNK